MLDSTQFSGTERYEVRECLGRGGMGTVYRALDRDSGAELALKVLDQQGADGLLRFKNEFRSVQSVRHRNLVRLGELGELGGQWFYTMELVAGTDLLRAVSRRPTGDRREHPTMAGRKRGLEGALEFGRIESGTYPADRASQPMGAIFDEPRLRRLLPQLAEGLAELHAAGKVHRDIKPSNILVTDDDRLVLLDFGMIFDTDRTERMTGSGVMVGTGAYMAPEQAAGRSLTPGPAADWYALGTLLYELMAGRLPFEGSLVEVLMHKRNNSPSPPSSCAPGVPEDLEKLCLSLLRANAEERPSGEHVLRALGVRRGRTAPVKQEHRSPAFVGRERELQVIVDAARGLTEPTTIILEGYSGAGKSSIVRRAGEILRQDESSTIMLSGRCFERESVPFKGFDGVLDSLTRWLAGLDDDDVRAFLPDNVGYLPLVFPALRGVPSIAEVPPVDTFGLGQREVRARVFDGLAQLLTLLAADHPIVVHIDDTQWATEDTWAILQELAHSPHKPRLLLLLTRRPHTEGPDPASVLGQATRITVACLPAEEAELLARLVLASAGGDGRDAAGIAREAEGHPMFIRRLARHAGRKEGAENLALDDIIRDDVAGVHPSARRCLEVVCVAGVPLNQRTVALAAGVGLAEVLTELTPGLVRAHLLRSLGGRASDTIEHFHERVRQAVLAAIEPAELVRLHGRVAQALEQSGAADANPLLVVQHLLAAGRMHHAAHRAIAGALRAAERFAFDYASELLQLALSLEVLDPARTRELNFHLANALVNAGRGSEAADVYLRLAESATNAFERLECKRHAAEKLLFSGQVERGMHALEDVLAELGEKLPSSERSALWAIARERLQLRLCRLRWVPRDRGDIRPRDCERLELYNAIAVGLSLVDHIRAASYMAKHLRLALKIGTRSQLVRALAVESVFCASQGKKARALTIADLAETLAADADTDHCHARAYAAFARAAPAYFIDNDWRRALELTVAAEEQLHEGSQATGWESDTAQAYQCFTRMYLGELGGLQEQVDRWVSQAARRGSTYGVVSLRSRVVVPRLAADRSQAARAELEESMSCWMPWHQRFLLQHYYALHSHCELALYDDDPGRARTLCLEQHSALESSMLLRTPILRAEFEFACARIDVAMASSTQGSAREQHLRNAAALAESLRNSPLPAPRSWATLLDATHARLRGQQDHAQAQLAKAVSQLEASSCHLIAHAAKLAHAQLLGGSAGQDLERQVHAWARENDIASLEQLAHVFAPGWFSVG